jgi:DNA-binding NarL/FixJ family response regulator
MVAAAPQTLRLLVADDHTLFRELLARHLTSLGHTVVGQATDGEHAVRLCHQHQPDVVLMDVAMPVLDGIAATRNILRVDRRQRIVMVSMHADALTVRLALAAGARGFVSKDSPMDELSVALTSVMGGDIALSSDLDTVVGERSESTTIEPLLTEREEEVLSLLARGTTTAQIAAQLFISQKTVKNHLAAIYDKLDVPDRTQAVVRAARLGIVRLERE